MSKAVERQSQRDRLLEAALVHIPFEGWSRRALLAGAADTNGIDRQAVMRRGRGSEHRVFESGGIAAVRDQNQDAVFGVREDLVMLYARHDDLAELPPGLEAGDRIQAPFFTVDFDFTLAPDESS